MLTSGVSWFIERTINRMKFPSQSEGARSISDPILQTFKRGCLFGLHGELYESFLKQSNELPWHLRAFFHEGHAMGTAGRAACSLIRFNPESMMRSANFEAMRYIGYGFWNGVAVSYPVPLLTERKGFWKTVPSFERYQLLITNGLGFATGLFAGAFDKQMKDHFCAVADKRRSEAAFHGIGRVLWLLYLNNFRAIQNILKEYADIAEPLAVGLGFAMTFTQVRSPDDICRSIDQFPDHIRPDLIRGAGIALQVHAGNDSESRMAIERSISGELREWYEGALAASTDAGTDSGWYPRFHELTRRYAMPREVIANGKLL